MLITDISITSYSLTDLCPNTSYTMALRAHDVQGGKSSAFSTTVEFSTDPGVPTPPRYVRGRIDSFSNPKQLIITWSTPEMLNAIIHKYQIRWTVVPKLCTGSPEDDRDILEAETDNANTFEYVRNNTADTGSLSVCVRAVTIDGEFGSWGTQINIDTSAGLRGSGSTDECNALTTVAVVAALTVAASLIMSIVLSISVVQKGWCCAKTKNTKKQ